MKLEKAIETLSDYKMESAFEATPDFVKALKIGIEGLKREIQNRQGTLAILLPGETE